MLYSEKEYKDQDFTGQDLRGQDLSDHVFLRCDFTRADLTGANCTNSSFVGSVFRDTLLTNVNFTNANLGATVFEPADCYGMTVTLQCKTFLNMRVSRQWWLCWAMLHTLMLPSDDTESLRDKLIAVIGAVRYVKLKELFARRDL